MLLSTNGMASVVIQVLSVRPEHIEGEVAIFSHGRPFQPNAIVAARYRIRSKSKIHPVILANRVLAEVPDCQNSVGYSKRISEVRHAKIDERRRT
jgi:hypothetical protein